jgi:glyoxylase-like metal-dependent hydrolase (beta-lactamase superfamily II)
MIDTNMPGTYDRFLVKLGGLGIDLADIKYLLLTHHHDDHVGFAADLLHDTDARVIVHERAIPITLRIPSRSCLQMAARLWGTRL